MINKLINFIFPRYLVKARLYEQCCSTTNSSRDFNVCIRERAHKGAHCSADGETW